MLFRAIAWFLLFSTSVSLVHPNRSLRTTDTQSKSIEEGEVEGEDDAKNGPRVAESWNGAEPAWSPESDPSEDDRDKRRLGSALNIGRGRDMKQVGKRDPRDRGHEEREAPEGSFGPTGDETDKRNLGSAMNLIKVRKNTDLGFVPERELFVGEQLRDRRRLGAAMNLKKLTNNAKNQPHF